MKRCAVVFNHSITTFEKTAKKLVAALKKEGFDAFSVTNNDLALRNDKDIDFPYAVFFDKDILLALRLERLGVRLFNSASVIENCDDKRRTAELLAEFPMPKTLCPPLSFRFSEKAAEEFSHYAVSCLSLPLVMKFAFGSLGEQVFLLNTRQEVFEAEKSFYSTPRLYQSFISSSKGRDLRLYLVGGRVCGSMLRENSNDFRANVALGGSASPIDPPSEFVSLAKDVSGVLGADFCAVDLLFSEDGHPILCEVNSNALFEAMDACNGTDIASCIASHVKAVSDRDSSQTVDINRLFL